jgi:hypothetical protein
MGGEAGKTLHLSACNSNYAELNDWMTANNEMDGMWK